MYSLIKRFLIFFFLLVFASVLSAQETYRLFNKTNHSELTWKTYRTENFDIVYSNGLKRTAEKAGSIAEKFYLEEQKILGLKFKRRITFFITDADDIANGAASYYGYFFIYVNPSEYSNSFTGKEGWLRKVIGHEMIHTLIFEETRSWSSFFLPLSGVSAEIHEGMAQFYSGEIWGYARGETWLGRGFIEKDLSYRPGDPDYGGLLYSKGASKIRVLREELGDEKIASIFKNGGGFPGYSFNRGYKNVTGESWQNFCKRWKKKVAIEYGEISKYFEKPDFIKPADTGKAKFNVIQGSVIAEDGYFIAGVLRNGSRNTNLYFVNKKTKRISKISSTVTGEMQLSPSGKWLVFVRQHYGKYSSVTKDLFIYDRIQKNTYRITKNRRIVGAAFLEEQRIAFIAGDGECTNLYTCDIRGDKEKKVTDFSGEVRLLNLSSSPEGDFVAASLYNGNKKLHGLLIVNMVSGEKKQFTPGYRCRYPWFSGKGNGIFYSAVKDGAMNINYLNLGNYKTTEITRVQGDIRGCGNERDGVLPVIWRSNRRTWETGFLDSDRKPEVSSSIRFKPLWQKLSAGYSDTDAPEVEGEHKGYYWSISSLKHRMIVPVPFYVDQQFTVGLINMWSDMSGDNRIVIFGAVNRNKFSESNYSLTYHNGSTIFDLDTNVSYLDTITLDYAKRRLFERKSSFSIKLSLPLKSRRDMFEIHKFGIEYLYEKAKVLNGKDFMPDKNGLIGKGIVGEPSGYIESVLTFSYEYRKREPFAKFIRSSSGINAIYSFGTEKLGGDDSFEYIHFTGHIFGKLMKGIYGYIGGGVRAMNGRVAPQRMIGVDTYGFSDPSGLMPGLYFPRRTYQRGGKRSVSGDRMINLTAELQYPFLEMVNLVLFLDFATLRNTNVQNHWLKEGTWGLECQYPLFKGGVLAGGFAGDIYNPGGKWKPFLLFKGQIRL